MAGARPFEPGAREVSKDTRVFGASVVVAERASQKPVCRAKEHAARDDRTIRQGLDLSYGTETRRFQGETEGNTNLPPGLDTWEVSGRFFSAVKLDKSTNLPKY